MRIVFLLALALLFVIAICSPATAARDVRIAFQEIPPSFFTGENGKPAGLFVDMSEDLAGKEGWNIIWVPGTLSENLDRLSSGQIDLMPGIVNTPDRGRLYDFNRVAAISAWSQVYAPPGSGINTILDLDGKRIAILKGDNNGIAFRDYARKFNINIQYVEKNTLDEVFAGTKAGEADAVVAFSVAGQESANKYGLTETTVMFNPTSISFAVPKGTNADLLAAIDRYLVEGKSDPSSTYSRTMQKWFGMKASWVVPSYLWWGLAFVAGLAVLFVVMSVVLRREVRRKTAELVRKNEELQAAYGQLAATEEELRENYQELQRSDQSLIQARKKLNLLNMLTFQDIQTGIFSLVGFIHLAKNAGCSKEAEARLGKGEEILSSVRTSMDFVKKYQDLGISQPRWQNVNYVLINAISHIDFSKISRTVDLEGLEIYADPLLEDVFLALMENVLAVGATEVSIRYRKNAGNITILVRDNGPGVLTTEKEKIFEWGSKGRSGTSHFLAREILSVTEITITETGEAGSGACFEIVVSEGAFRFRDPAAGTE